MHLSILEEHVKNHIDLMNKILIGFLLNETLV